MTDDTLRVLFARIGYPLRVLFVGGRWRVEPDTHGHAPLNARSAPTLALALERLAADSEQQRAEGVADSSRCDAEYEAGAALLASKVGR